MGHAAFDAFRHQFLLRALVRLELELVLEISIAAPAAHGADRSHAAVFLEATALIQDELARALVCSRKQIADHH